MIKIFLETSAHDSLERLLCQHNSIFIVTIKLDFDDFLHFVLHLELIWVMHAHNVGFFFLAFVETLFSVVFRGCDELTLLVMLKFLVYHVSNLENLMLARAYVRHTRIDNRFLLCIVHKFDRISGQI